MECVPELPTCCSKKLQDLSPTSSRSCAPRGRTQLMSEHAFCLVGAQCSTRAPRMTHRVRLGPLPDEPVFLPPVDTRPTAGIPSPAHGWYQMLSKHLRIAQACSPGGARRYGGSCRRHSKEPFLWRHARLHYRTPLQRPIGTHNVSRLSPRPPVCYHRCSLSGSPAKKERIAWLFCIRACLGR